MSEKEKLCPQCKKSFLAQDKDVFPFCSERCKLLDLGNWLDGSYGVPAEEQEEEE